MVTGAEFSQLRGGNGGGQVGVLAAHADGEGGHAGPGERKMVAAVVAAGVRMGVALQRQSEILRGLLHQVPQGGPLGPGEAGVAGAAEGREAVEIQVRGNASGGDGRVLGQVAGTEQPALLGGDRRKIGAALGFGVERGPGARHLDQHRRAGGVIDCAVVDRVAIHRWADAEVVPMRGEDDGLILQPRIGAGDHSNHVPGVERRYVEVHFQPQLGRQGPGVEAALVGRGERAGEGQTGRAEQLFAGLRGDPAGQREGRGAGRRVGLGHRTALAADHLPAIAGGRGSVDDDGAQRALAGRLFVFVGPAAVVGQRLAGKELRVVGGRFAGKQNDHLALHVDALVIVPGELGSADAVADEDRRGFEIQRGLAAVGGGDEILQPAQFDGSVQSHNGQAGARADGRDELQRDSLDEAAVVASRLHARCGELRRDVFLRQQTAASARAASLQQIACQEFYMRPDALAFNAVGLCGKQGGCGK